MCGHLILPTERHPPRTLFLCLLAERSRAHTQVSLTRSRVFPKTPLLKSSSFTPVHTRSRSRPSTDLVLSPSSGTLNLSPERRTPATKSPSLKPRDSQFLVQFLRVATTRTQPPLQQPALRSLFTTSSSSTRITWTVRRPAMLLSLPAYMATRLASTDVLSLDGRILVSTTLPQSFDLLLTSRSTHGSHSGLSVLRK